MKRLAVILFALLVATSGSARADSYGTELPFVLGTSARVSALGVTGVSLSGDASVHYYNPAALSELQWKEFSFYRSSLFESGAAYHSLSYAQPLLSNGTIAISFMRVDVGGIEERDGTNQLISDDLHNAQTRVLLGFGRTIASNITAGFNLVFDNHTFGSYSGSGVGLDIGLSASQSFSTVSWLRGLRQGFVIRNVVEPTVRLDQERVADPSQLAFGLSMLSEVSGVTMSTSLDIVNPKFSPLSLHIGQEMTYMNSYSLRFGVDETTPTFGLGARYHSVAMDYAYRSQEIGDNHRVSLAVRFGTSLGDRHSADRTRRETEVNTRIGERMEALEQQQITRSLEKARAFLADSRYDDALNYFEIALLWDPDNEEARTLADECHYQKSIGLGRDAMASDDFAGALVYLREAIRLRPDDEQAVGMMAECNTQITLNQSSAAALNQMLKTAVDLYAERRFSEAMGGFEEVLAIDPNSALAIEYKSKCSANIEAAIQRHKRAATNYAEKEDYERAIQELRSALRYRNDAALASTIERYTAIYNSTENSSTPTPIVIPDPTQPPMSSATRQRLETRYASGIKFFDSGNFRKAIDELSYVWAVDAKFHNVSSLLGKAYLFVGMNYYAAQNYEDAIHMWERALSIDPTNRKAERYLRKASEEARKLGGMNGN